MHCAILLAAFSLLTSYVNLQPSNDCADYTPLGISFIQLATDADIVLYGQDVTPVSECDDTDGAQCQRTDIIFQVANNMNLII